MASPFNMKPNMNARYESVIRDRYGAVIAELGSQDYLIHDPNLGPQRHRIQESFQLVCGTIYSPLMSMGKERTIILAVCDECRYPYHRGEEPRHGICNQERGHTCSACQQFLCPQHSIKCSDDEMRCPRCADNHQVRRGFLRLFFREED